MALSYYRTFMLIHRNPSVSSAYVIISTTSPAGEIIRLMPCAILLPLIYSCSISPTLMIENLSLNASANFARAQSELSCGDNAIIAGFTFFML